MLQMMLEPTSFAASIDEYPLIWDDVEPLTWEQVIENDPDSVY